MEQKQADEIMEKALEMAKNLFANGKYAECKPVLTQYMKCSPKNPEEALMHLALSCHKLGQNKQALQIFKEMTKESKYEKAKGDIYNNIAVVYSSTGNFDKAIENLNKAIEADPKRGLFWSNLGLQYRHKNEHQTAIGYFKKAVDLMPKQTACTAINNLGACYSENFDLKEGEKWFRKNLEIDDNYSVSHVDLCYNLMLQDRWEEAFYHHNWRFNHFKQLQRFKDLDQSEKRWDGEKSLKDKTYLLYCEQGIGDVLMYLRYVPILKSLGCKIVFYCYDRLTNLLSGMEEIDEIVELGNVKDIIEMTTIKEEELPAHDFNSSILSLPYLLKKYEPFYKKYFNFKEKMDLSSYDAFKIGIVWAGSPLHPDDSKRSCYLKEFAPIADIPGIKLFNLQKDSRPRKYAYQEDLVDYTKDVDFKVVDCSEHFKDFYDLAKFVNSMDLIISVDTAPIHLAGMLEKPVLMLNAFNADPRWGLNCCRVKDWYPTITPFQQKERGNWKEVFERVSKEVKKLVN